MSKPTTTVRRIDKPSDDIKVQCGGSCSNPTAHEVLSQVDSDYHEDDFSAWDNYFVIRCRGCGDISFCKQAGNSENYDYDHNGNAESLVETFLYPNRISGKAALLHTEDIPRGVLTIYEETQKAIASNLCIIAGIGMRAIVEAVCKDRRAPGGNLFHKIDGLATIGLLTTDGCKILHTIRVMGNDAAHEAKANTIQELTIAFEIVEYLLQTAYIIKGRFKALKAAKPRKRPRRRRPVAPAPPSS